MRLHTISDNPPLTHGPCTDTTATCYLAHGTCTDTTPIRQQRTATSHTELEPIRQKRTATSHTELALI